MADPLWYDHVARTGEEPHCQRLSRRPMPAQWEAAIHLALSYAQGKAGFRQVWIDRTNEEIWYWPEGDTLIEDTRTAYHGKPMTGWWIVPRRVAVRARRIYEAAILTACHTHGGATVEQIAAVLERWMGTGHWRRVAATVAPRHPGPGKRPRARQRSGGVPAWAPRPLPDLRHTTRPVRRTKKKGDGA